MEEKFAAEKRIFHRLTRLYIIALVAVAVISLFGQLLIQFILNELIDDSHLVNIAGRQRMYSQKITKQSLLVFQLNTLKINSVEQRKILETDLLKWAKNHNDLKSGKSFSTISFFNKNNTQIAQLYEQLDQNFNQIKKNVGYIISDQPINIQKIALEKVQANEGDFLIKMNKIVEYYDITAKQKVTKTRQAEGLLFCLLITVLIFEALFIFKPIAQQIKNSVKMLTETSQNLLIANEELLITNRKLEHTKNELLTTNNEKMALKIAEEKVRTTALVTGQEQERKRVSRELHDGIGQMLTGIRLQVEALNSAKNNDEKQKQAIAELKALIGETIETTRTVAYNLAPSVLADFGLNAALRLLIDQFGKASDISFQLTDSHKSKLPELMETALYRIVQEAIHNAVKYANASKIGIILIEKEGKILLSVIDNGQGFEPIKTAKNIKKADTNGLKNIKTRTEILNGNIDIISKIGNGTKIIVEIPI